MIILQPDFQLLEELDPCELMQKLERAARVCYKSEDKITADSAEPFLRKIIERGHLAMVEHASISVLVTTDRGVSHEIVRHRLASYAQESTRYCNYGNGKYGGNCTFIVPYWFSPEAVKELSFDTVLYTESKPEVEGVPLYDIVKNLKDKSLDREVLWLTAVSMAETFYLNMVAMQMSAQAARSVLPNSTKTEIVMTMNLREWIHFFKMRDAETAHPDMQIIARMLHSRFSDMLPVIFPPKKERGN